MPTPVICAATAPLPSCPARPAASHRGAVAALSLATLLASLGISIVHVALPTFAKVFAASFAAVQGVVLAYLLALTALIVTVGRWGDVFGRRRLLLAGAAVFVVGSLLAGLAPNLATLIAARAVQGVGGAVMMALPLALVGGSVPRAQTGRAMGVLGTMSAIGTALGPAVGGTLLAAFGWRSLFALCVMLGLVVLALGHRYLADDSPRATGSRRPLEFGGPTLLAATLVAYAFSLTGSRGKFGVPHGVLLAVAGVGAGWFVHRDRRAAAPLIPAAVLRDRAFRTNLALSALVSTVVMTSLVTGPFYLVRTLGLDAARVGWVVAAGPAVSALAGVPAGRWVDRFGPWRTSAAGLAGLVLGCGLLALLPAGARVVGYVVPIVVLTAGYAHFQAANNTAALGGMPVDRRGVASGLLSLARNLGLITGASAMGAFFVYRVGGTGPATETPAAVAAAFRGTFGLAALLAAGALAVAMRGGRRNAEAALADKDLDAVTRRIPLKSEPA